MKKVGFFLSLCIVASLFMGAGCSTPSSTNSTPTPQPVSSLEEYFISMYKTKPIAEEEFNKKNLKEVVKVFSGNTQKEDYYEIIMTTFYSDANWNDDKDHDVYMEVSNDAGFAYYGPFKDNLNRLNKELESWESEQKITEYDEFSSFELVK
jgi:hypothetical protein